MKSLHYLPILFCLLTGCSSLDRVDALAKQQLQIGASSKADVVNAIGLPQQVEVDKQNGRESWYYTGLPASKSYFIPMPTASVASAPGMQTVYWSDIGAKNIVGGHPVKLVCVFDEAGRLVFVQQLETPT